MFSSNVYILSGQYEKLFRTFFPQGAELLFFLNSSFLQKCHLMIKDGIQWKVFATNNLSFYRILKLVHSLRDIEY